MTILLSRRTIFALACGLTLAGGQFVFAGTDTTSPRVVSVEPGPAAGVVDQLGLDEIQVGFDETVMIPRGSITVWTVGGGPVRGLASSFDIGTNVLTITLPRAIQTDRVTLVLDYTITDMAGNPLDGEIFDPTDPFLPSGNSLPGGLGVFRINVLQGDATRDGVVDGQDGDAVLASIGRCAGDEGFNANADLNQDGCVNVLDVNIYQNGL